MATRLERAIDWGTALSVGKGAITYAFADAGEKAATPVGKIKSFGLNAYEKAQFKLAFKLVASFTDLRFREVKDAAAADLVVATYRDDESTLGAMGPPGYGRSAGYGAFNFKGIGWDRASPGAGGLEQGGYGFVTIIHELGHGLGLAHPHDNGGSSSLFPRVSHSGDLGRFDLNQGVYTTMSYNDGWKTNPDGTPDSHAFGYQGTPMAVDIAVLQQKYGVNDAYQRGKTVYTLPDANQSGTFYACIWDAGGRDAIVNDSALPSAINLRPATLRPEPGGGGYISRAEGILGGYTIAHGVKVENARGGSAGDVIVGNAVENRLDGGGGNDALYGRARGDRLHGKDGDDRLYGGSGADLLRGGSGDDAILGGGGADVLYAGPGSSRLSGGPGPDTFVFDVAPVPGAVVTVTDFRPGRDAIHLSAAAFDGIGPAGGLSAAAFGLGKAASNLASRILYDPLTGALRHDPDGTGSTEAVQFAKLGSGLAVNHADFVVMA